MAFENRDPTGGLFGYTTRKLNLPELGVSEFFGGLDTSTSRESLVSGDVPSSNLSSTGTLSAFAPDYLQDSFTAAEPAGGGGGDVISDPIVYSQDVDGANIQTTETGDVLGLEDLKQTSGYLDWASSQEDPTGGAYLDYLDQLADERAQQEAEVEEIYKESSSLLDQREQALRESRPDLLQLAISPFQQAIPQIQAAAEQGRGRFQQGVTEAQQTGRGLLSDAKRLANELQQRNRQQFGGAALSSAAQAAGELLSRQTAQGFGDIRQNTATAVQNLQQGLIDFNNGIDAKLQQVNFQIQEATSQAEIKFRDALAAIDADRSILASQKTVDKINILRDYREQLRDINAQKVAYQQQVDLLKQQAQIQATQGIEEILSATQGTTGMIAGQQDMLAQSGIDTTNLMGTSQAIESPTSGLFGRLFGGREEEESLFNLPQGFNLA